MKNNIEKIIKNKEPIHYITTAESAREILIIINDLKNEIVEDYIIYYCQIYIQETFKLEKKINYFKINDIYKILNLMMPNRKYKDYNFKDFFVNKEINRFVYNIKRLFDEVKYKVFCKYISEKKYIKTLRVDFLVFKINDTCKYIDRAITENNINFIEYIDFVLIKGIEERIEKKIKLKNESTIASIVCTTIVDKGLSTYMDTTKLHNLIMATYSCFCERIMINKIEKNQELSSFSGYSMTATRVLFTFSNLKNEFQDKCINYWSDYYYLKYKKDMRYDNFRKILGIQHLSPASLNNDYLEKINNIKEKIDKQRIMTDEKIENSNRNQLDMKIDKWILIFREGPTIKNKSFDFSKIKSTGFKYETKLYIINELKKKDMKNIITLPLTVECFNFFYRRRKECYSCANIKQSDVEALSDYLQNELRVKDTTKKRSINTVRKMMGKVKDIIEYIIIYGKDNKCETAIPKRNVMKGIKFRNTYQMTKKTEIIPDVVLEQIQNYSYELSSEYRLILEIFENTGLRLKSVMYLKEDCLEKSRYKGVSILKYNPFKLENIKKKSGTEVYEQLIISNDLADKIQKQIIETKDLRIEYGLREIFIKVYKEFGRTRVIQMQGSSFSEAINRIIKKYDIKDYDGKVWRFTSRQIRKTLVYIMKKNGATDVEISYVLGHYKKQTLELWYKEIDEQRIEDLNHEFFKKRFDLDIGKEYLKTFSEEEKKCLYIDFITDYRRVPLGYCSKSLKNDGCEEACNSKSCENCDKIITGSAFLKEWENLRDDRIREITDLVNYYTEKNIDEGEYREYKEYKNLEYDINLYKETINKIKKE